MHRPTAVLVLLATVAVPVRAQQVPSGGTIAIRAARLIDGTGSPAVRNGVVVVTDDRIVAAGPSARVTIPAGARIIDLGDATLMPGFIDAHTHIIGRTLGDPDGDVAAVKDFPAFGAILGVGNAERTLLAGFTTIRNVGSSNFDDIALRKAINENRIRGPRMQTAGHSLGITGGHCDENAYRPGLFDNGIEDGIANGPSEVRAAVRYQIKYGADVIKTCATGGVLSEGDAVGTTQYDFDELKAMVDEAKKHERHVAAHAHGAEGIRIATRAGVRSIEHGSFLDAEGARLMREHGTWLVPTLMAGEAVERIAKTGVLKGLRAEKALAAAAAMRNAVKLAATNGVPIALGTDAGVIPHGSNGHEFTLLVEWGGLTPMEAIVAGTMNSAKVLGWERNIGSLTAGKWADVVAVPGDPIADIRRMESTVFVMKAGVVFKAPSTGGAAIVP